MDEAGRAPRSASSRSEQRGLRGPAAAIVVSLALAISFAALFLVDRSPSREEVGIYLRSQRPVVEERARRVVTLLLSYDATNLEDRADQMSELATGEFMSDYRRVPGALIPVLRESGISSRSRILVGPEVSFTTGSGAIALVHVAQTTASGQDGSRRRTIEYEMKLELLDTDAGGWRVNGVEVISQKLR